MLFIPLGGGVQPSGGWAQDNPQRIRKTQKRGALMSGSAFPFSKDTTEGDRILL